MTTQLQLINIIIIIIIIIIIQYAMLMQHTVISGLSGSTLFFYLISQTTRFKQTKKKSEH